MIASEVTVVAGCCVLFSETRTWFVRNSPSAKGSLLAVTVKRMSTMRAVFVGSLVVP